MAAPHTDLPHGTHLNTTHGSTAQNFVGIEPEAPDAVLLTPPLRKAHQQLWAELRPSLWPNIADKPDPYQGDAVCNFHPDRYGVRVFAMIHGAEVALDNLYRIKLSSNFEQLGQALGPGKYKVEAYVKSPYGSFRKYLVSSTHVIPKDGDYPYRAWRLDPSQDYGQDVSRYVSEHNELAREDAEDERAEEFGGGPAMSGRGPGGDGDEEGGGQGGDPSSRGGRGQPGMMGSSAGGRPNGGMGGPPRGVQVPVGMVWAPPEGLMLESVCTAGRMVWSPRVQTWMPHALVGANGVPVDPAAAVTKAVEEVKSLAKEAGSGLLGLASLLAPKLFDYMRESAADRARESADQRARTEAMATQARFEVEQAALKNAADAQAKLQIELARMKVESEERVARMNADTTRAQAEAAQRQEQWQQMQAALQAANKAPPGPSATEMMLTLKAEQSEANARRDRELSEQRIAADKLLAEERRRADEKFNLLQQQGAETQRKSDLDRYEQQLRDLRDKVGAAQNNKSPIDSLFANMEQLDKLKNKLGVKDNSNGLMDGFAKDPTGVLSGISEAINSVTKFRAIEHEGAKQMALVEIAAKANAAQGAVPQGLVSGVTMNLPAPNVSISQIPNIPTTGTG